MKPDRTTYIGGSDVGKLMNGTDAERVELWLEKTGQAAPENLDWVIPVQIGSATEDFNTRYYEHITGETVTERQRFIRCPTHSFLGCTLDGYIESRNAVFEAKHVNAFADLSEVTARYQAQVHHQMMLRGCESAVLSIIRGTTEHHHFTVPFDPFYAELLKDRVAWFWACVAEMRAPHPLEPIAPPPVIAPTRKVDMTGNNAWAAVAGDWLGNREAAKRFDAAAKEIKAMCEADAAETHGHGIIARRSKTGALTIREMA